MQRRPGKSDDSTVLGKAELEAQEKEVKQYEQIFKELKNKELKGSQISTADQLVKKFNSLKEEHHKFYKYIHELSEEVTPSFISTTHPSLKSMIQLMTKLKRSTTG